LGFVSVAWGVPVGAVVAALDATGEATLVFVPLGAVVFAETLGALGVVLFACTAGVLARGAAPSVVAACAKPLVLNASARLERASNLDTVVLSVFAFFISCILRVVGFNWLHEKILEVLLKRTRVEVC